MNDYEKNIEALAKWLEISINDIEDSEEQYDDMDTFDCKVGDKIETYSVCTDEEFMKNAVADSLENLFDELDVAEFCESVLPYLTGDKTDLFSEEEIEEYFEDDFKDYLEGLIDDNDELVKELSNYGLNIEDYLIDEEANEYDTDELFGDYASARLNELRPDVIEEFIARYEDTALIKEYCNPDFEILADSCIAQYGEGHELARYDNQTNTEDFDGVTYYFFKQDEKDLDEE